LGNGKTLIQRQARSVKGCLSRLFNKVPDRRPSAPGRKTLDESTQQPKLLHLSENALSGKCGWQWSAWFFRSFFKQESPLFLVVLTEFERQAERLQIVADIAEGFNQGA
jgi:hypothetical protein